MPRPEIKALEELSNADLLAVTARGAHLLRERDMSLDGLDTLATGSAGEHQGALINPLINPLEIPPSAFGEGRILVQHDKPNSIMVDGESCKLTPVQFEVVAVLAANRGKLVTHDFTLQTVWPDFSPESYRHMGLSASTKISGALHFINKALGDEDLGHPSMGAIRGVRGVGHIALISRDVRPSTITS